MSGPHVGFWYRWALQPPQPADFDATSMIVMFTDYGPIRTGKGGPPPPDPTYWCRTFDFDRWVASCAPRQAVAERPTEALEPAEALAAKLTAAMELVGLLPTHIANLATDALPTDAIVKELTLLHAKLVETLTGSELFIAKLRKPDPASGEYRDNETLLRGGFPNAQRGT